MAMSDSNRKPRVIILGGEWLAKYTFRYDSATEAINGED